MRTIRPSEGLNHLKERVIVEGKIVGPKSYANRFGGRWLIAVADSDSQTYNVDALVVVNEKPEQNSAVRDLCLEVPSNAILSLFRDTEFGRLFQPGITFRAEAVVDNSDGKAWFNVWQMFLLEPFFKIGVKQIYNIPLCQRRLFLSGRGIKGKSNQNDGYIGHFFVGNLVHSIFQKIAVSNNRERLISEFKSNPDEFLLSAVLPESLLSCGMGTLDNQPRFSGRELGEVKKHIMRLVDSRAIRNLLITGDDWVGEIPVSSTSIHGLIDLRDSNRLIELKTGEAKIFHQNQVKGYLVGEMIEEGVQIKDQRNGYLVYSSANVEEDNRVYKIDDNSANMLEVLERFLVSRHRLLLVTAGFKLPKIEFEEGYCKTSRCDYFKRSCHFYCQVERSWSCDCCDHSSFCTEHSEYHPVDMIDDANRIRTVLLDEIEFMRRSYPDSFTWSAHFDVVDDKGNNVFLLDPQNGYNIDPPSPGEKVLVYKNGYKFPFTGYVLEVKRNGHCEVVSRDGLLLEKGEVINLAQPRSELNGLFGLLGCLDELQQDGSFSFLKGIEFASGSVVSGRPKEFSSIEIAIEEPLVTDIFCQSFSLEHSEALLKRTIEHIQGRILIVTESRSLFVDNCFDTRGNQVIDLTSQCQKFTDAIYRVKTKLNDSSCWLTSPDLLLSNNSIFDSLPDNGIGYFKYIILYEANSVTSLEYFLLRKFGKRTVVIGDANCVGRPLRTQMAKLLGLSDNLISSVFNRGFPVVKDKFLPVIIKPSNQKICSQLKLALESCRMITPDSEDSRKKISLIICDSNNQDLQLRPLYFLEIKAKGDTTPKEVKLNICEFITYDQYLEDIEDLRYEIKVTLVSGKKLRSSTSGRVYEVISAPINRICEGNNWLVTVYANNLTKGVSFEEAIAAVQKVKELKENNINPDTIAIMSSSHQQLSMMLDEYGNELAGIALRTPYGIRGEYWDYCIITCACTSVDMVEPKELYTMIRASRVEVFLISDPKLIINHSLLRSIN